jgi:hypothetical protein
MIVADAINDIHGDMMVSHDDYGVILGCFRDGCN